MGIQFFRQDELARIDIHHSPGFSTAWLA